jgi:hypothetical protein
LDTYDKLPLGSTCLFTSSNTYLLFGRRIAIGFSIFSLLYRPFQGRGSGPVVDTSGYAFGKRCVTKRRETAADTLCDRVLPFYREHEFSVKTISTGGEDGVSGPSHGTSV